MIFCYFTIIGTFVHRDYWLLLKSSKGRQTKLEEADLEQLEFWFPINWQRIADANTNSNTRTDAYTNSDTNADAGTHADTHGDTDLDVDTYADIHADTDTHADACVHFRLLMQATSKYSTPAKGLAPSSKNINFPFNGGESNFNFGGLFIISKYSPDVV